MKTHTRTLLAALAASAMIAGSAQAATLTFDAGFANNVDVNGNYGSNITTTGLAGQEFIISDGLGATPNITLTWPTGPEFEWHNGGGPEYWQEIEDVTVTGDTSIHVLQANNSATSEITFTPDAGYAVVFGSVDYGFDPALGGAVLTGTFTITRDSDDTVVFTTASSGAGGDAETVDLSYTGAVGESYTLKLELSGGSSNWGAIDDLKFGQIVPEPGSLALMALGGLCVLRRRRD